MLKALEALPGVAELEGYQFVEERAPWDAEARRLEKELDKRVRIKPRVRRAPVLQTQPHTAWVCVICLIGTSLRVFVGKAYLKCVCRFMSGWPADLCSCALITHRAKAAHCADGQGCAARKEGERAWQAQAGGRCGVSVKKVRCLCFCPSALHDPRCVRLQPECMQGKSALRTQRHRRAAQGAARRRGRRGACGLAPSRPGAPCRHCAMFSSM